MLPSGFPKSMNCQGHVQTSRWQSLAWRAPCKFTIDELIETRARIELTKCRPEGFRINSIGNELLETCANIELTKCAPERSV